MYVATQIAIESDGISRDRNGRRTPRPLRSANTLVRFDVHPELRDQTFTGRGAAPLARLRASSTRYGGAPLIRGLHACWAVFRMENVGV